MSGVPQARLLPQNHRPVNEGGQYVLYWMTMNRRLVHNFALDRAVEQARELNRPLLVLEALRLDYPPCLPPHARLCGAGHGG